MRESEKTSQPNQNRLWRPERRTEVELPHDEGHAWAVSYSDLLMVLMSFFIIFFNAQDKKGEDVLKYLALTLQSDFGGQKTKGANGQAPPREQADLEDSIAGESNFGAVTPRKKGKAAAISEREMKSSDSSSDAVDGPATAGLASLLSKTLAEMNAAVTTSVDQEKISIELQGDVFQSRSYRIDPELAVALDRILAVLAPKEDQISIYFVGHSDSSRVTPSRRDRLSNNFELSSLRAASVVNYAIGKGFDSRHLFAQGVADNLGGARSLSIVIQGR